MYSKGWAFLDNMGLVVTGEGTTIDDTWDCGNCGAMFEEPAEDMLRRDVCPECGSLDVWVRPPDDEPPLSCPKCGSETQWKCLGEFALSGGASAWIFRCMACDFEGGYSGHPDAT